MNEKARILIIEDDNDLVAALTKILENKGFNAEAAYDPEEGWDKLKQEQTGSDYSGCNVWEQR